MRTAGRSRLTAAILTAVICTAATAVAQSSRPNVILIIGDDIGWPDYGFMPSPRMIDTNQGEMPINEVVRTPNLDALAAGGVVFRNAHTTASTCIPSLRTLLSTAGMQPLQWDDTRDALEDSPFIDLPGPPGIFPRIEVEHIRTLPKDLGALGYKSWEGGKFWEGTSDLAGFTHGLTTNVGGLILPYSWDFGRAGWDPQSCGDDADPGAVCPALDPLRDFLDEVEGNPFFVWFAPALPHGPFTAPQNLRDPFEALGLQSCATADCWGNCSNCPNQVNYLSNVSWLDNLIGELVDELETRDLRDDTLLIYLADNGWGLNFQVFAGQGRGKKTPYELGFRTPLIFNWPGHVPAGVAYDDLISTVDVAPTICDYTGIDPLPEQTGMSLRERIEGGPSLGRTEVIGLYPGVGHFLRTDTWRYLRFASDDHEELYRIDIDPFELTNVAAQNPALVAQFATMVDDWEAAQRTPPERLEIAGRLLDSTTGEPLTGSQVELENGPVKLISIVGADGWFRFGPVEIGSYAISAGLRALNVAWLGTTDPVPAAVPVGQAGAFFNLTGTQTVAVPGPYGAQIRGILTDNLGAPLPDVQIDVSGVKGCDVVRTRVTTQADGSYRTENLPFTTYTVKATAPPGFQNVIVEGVVVDALDVFTQDLVAQPG